MKKNNNKVHAFLMLLLLVVTGVGAAAEKAEKEDDKNPLGCRDLGYQFELNVLNLLPVDAGERQSLFFIYNRRAQSVNLHQMLKDESTRSLYLNHTIRPHQWAVLSTSEKTLKYICAVDDAKLSDGKVVDCSESLKVCEYARVKYGLNNKGNYWFVDSSSKNSAVQTVLHYGIIPR